MDIKVRFEVRLEKRCIQYIRSDNCNNIYIYIYMPFIELTRVWHAYEMGLANQECHYISLRCKLAIRLTVPHGVRYNDETKGSLLSHCRMPN